MIHRHFDSSRRLVAGVALLAGAGSAVAVPGCSRGQETVLEVEAEDAVGQVQLNLTAVAASGTVYQLVNATFTITSVTTGEQSVVSSEDHPDDSVLLVELAPDLYDVELEPGFLLERLEGGSAEDASLAPAFALPRGSTKLPGSSRRRAASRLAFDVDAGVGGSSTPVDAALISENPVRVEIFADTFEFVNFVFSVGGDVVGTGTLGIGFEVEEQGGLSCSDDFEPNDTPEEAALFSATGGLDATLCSNDQDFFRFTPEVAPGTPFTVNVIFSHAQADIDAALFTGDGAPIAFGGSATDNEVLPAFATGQDFILQVFPFNIGGDVASYSVEVEVDQLPPPESDCCTTSDTPGCTVPEVNSCVCEIDSFCCQEAFDSVCVDEAIAFCDAQCGGPDPDPEPDPGSPT